MEQVTHMLMGRFLSSDLSECLSVSGLHMHVHESFSRDLSMDRPSLHSGHPSVLLSCIRPDDHMDHSVTDYWSGLFTSNSIPLAFGTNNPQLDTFMAVDSLLLLHAFGNLPLGEDPVVPMMSMAFTDPRTC